MTTDIIQHIDPKEQSTLASNLEDKTLTKDAHKAEKNAFLIKLSNGASLKTVKSKLKKAWGCRWHPATKSFSCPMSSKDSVERMLKEKNIKTTLQPFQDEYQEEERKIIVAEDSLLKPNVNKKSPYFSEQMKKLEERKAKQAEVKEEIEQLRNSAVLLEDHREDEITLPFRILGYNEKLHVLLWYHGKILELSMALIRN